MTDHGDKDELWEMERLIRVGKYRGDTNAIIYIVAVSNPNKAVNLIRDKTANPVDEVQDLGRVSANLLSALKLLPGDYVRADGQR